MPLVVITKDQVDSKLAAGWVGIGEDHGKPAGRELVRKLIAAGKVNVLFLEIPIHANCSCASATDATTTMEKCMKMSWLRCK